MKIFINYRREDEANMAFAIANALMAKFGAGNVFYDRQVIQPGSVFPHEIDKALDKCLLFIPIIGKEWLPIMKKRQSFEEKDYVLSEIEHAFEKGVKIVPVLIDNTAMPLEKELPVKIKALTSINAVYVSSDPQRLSQDIHNLIIELETLLDGGPIRPTIINPPIKKTDINSSKFKTNIEELKVVLSDQLEHRSFEEAGLTISEIMALDRDNIDAINAQAILDKQKGFGIIKSFKGPGTVTDAFFLKDGRRIIAAFDGIAGKSASAKPPTILILDIDSEQKLFEKPIQLGWKPTCIALSPDEQNMLLGNLYGIFLISVKTKEIVANYEAGGTACVSFLPDGKRALSGGSELLLWDLELGSVIYRFKGHEGKIQSLAVTPDGNKAVTGGEDATIRLWDLQKKSELWNIQGFKVNMQCIAISPDGGKILAGGNKIIRLVDLNSGKEIKNFAAHNGYTLSIAFSPDGLKALSGGTDNIFRYWDLKNGTQFRGYKVSGEWTRAVGFSPDNRYALSSDIGNVSIWALPE